MLYVHWLSWHYRKILSMSSINCKTQCIHKEVLHFPPQNISNGIFGDCVLYSDISVDIIHKESLNTERKG
jgi:hypothetical protein